MELKILALHRDRPRNDVHNLYERLFWDIEISHEYNLLPELSNSEIWDLASGFRVDSRYSVNLARSSVLKNFCAEFERLKNQFFDLVVSDQRFSYQWPRDGVYYQDRIHMSSAIFRDSAGHTMPPHLDNSHIVMQIIINLIDNTTSTELYTFDDVMPTYQASSKKNQGLAFFNNPGAIHGIRNVSQDRFILYSALTLF